MTTKTKLLTTPAPKLIALDLDGTLLTSTGQITERSALAIHELKKQGIRVVLSTGRPPRHIQDIAKKLDLREWVVAYNGAAIVNFETGDISYRRQLTTELTLNVLKTMREAYPEVLAGLETYHGWYWDEALFEACKAKLLERGWALPTAWGAVESFVQDSAIKLLFQHQSSSAWDLAKSLKSLDVACTWSHSSLLEVMHKAANKQESLAYLAQKFGISRAETAAFGDQFNDKEVLAWAGIGVAMGNALPELKLKADLVTSSNDDEGVAKVLEQWL